MPRRCRHCRGLLEHYRNLWETEETNLSGNQAHLLFERRQCLDLIDFYKSKNNQPALKELATLRLLEAACSGRSQPSGITDEDLAKLGNSSNTRLLTTTAIFCTNHSVPGTWVINYYKLFVPCTGKLSYLLLQFWGD